ncbi:hypothetical protein SAMN04490202_0984 [Pseudomonas reinekei]|nr:hypothetical protein SAMN04490202_0984 [Pseudomonas reinekei]
MLTYVGIDQMAWLSIPGDKSSGKDFKAWVDNFMLAKNAISCTSDELWGARNGLLHMGTAEAGAHKDPSIRKIYYTFGNAKCTKNDTSDVFVLKAEDLILGFLLGVFWFIDHLKEHPDQLAITSAKLGRALGVRDISPDPSA